MRDATAVAISVLLVCLGFAGVANAQVSQSVQVQGTFQSADCQTGQVTMVTSGGTDTFQATNQTVAYVNGSAVSLCSLQSYAGDSATAVLIPTGNTLVLSQVNVTAQAQSSTPGSTSGSFLSSPLVIGLGAALLGGIVGYLMGHDSTGQPTYTPTSTPFNTTSQPVYFPSGTVPTYLPSTYPVNQRYAYQGHSYYRCTNGGWTMNQTCSAADTNHPNAPRPAH